MFCKIGVLKNFNNFYKKRLKHRFLSVKFAKFFTITFFHITAPLAASVSRFWNVINIMNFAIGKLYFVKQTKEGVLKHLLKLT